MFDKYKLENGVSVVTHKMPGVNSVSVGLWVETGSRNETPENNGVSHFIEHMLFKGTEKRSAKKIAEIFDSIGGQINAFTSKECTCFYTKTLSKHINLSVTILADIFFNSLFDTKEIELEKNVIIEEINMYEDAPEETVHDVVNEVCWKKSLGYPILGTITNIESITREDILKYKNENYLANRLTIAVAGNFDSKSLKQILNRYFSSWETSNENVKYVENRFCKGSLYKEKDTEQTHFCISYPGIKSNADESYSALALNNILGGGMSSRLFQEIREKRGLAYTVYSYLSSYQKEGIFTIYSGMNPENFDSVKNLVEKEVNKVLKKGLSEREIKNAKEQLKGSFLLGLENSTAMMSYIGKSELLWGKIETPDEVLNEIDKINKDSIDSIINKVFGSGKYAIAAIGPEM